MYAHLSLISFALLTATIAVFPSLSHCDDSVWTRHTVANISQGADGVRLIDANHDGLLDIVTPWEEGGKISVSLHPGLEKVRQPWPTKIIADVPSPEDAVWADLDGDGKFEVITCAEGKERSVWVHWNTSGGPLGEWRSEPFPQLKDTEMWMYCTPAQVDGLDGVDLIVGSKGQNGSISWLQAPPDPTNLSQWKVHKISDAGWIMSLIVQTDKKGILENLLVSDRRDELRGAKQIRSPFLNQRSKPEENNTFPVHLLGSGDKEVMFMDYADIDQDGLLDAVVATYGDKIDIHRQTGRDGWQIRKESSTINMPPNTGTGKSVRVGDIDRDGDMDIALTCGNSQDKHGVMWLSYRKSITETDWQAHDIGGLTGTKFDQLELIDLDHDGDLDLLTCEERENLGVIWYENPIH